MRDGEKATARRRLRAFLGTHAPVRAAPHQPRKPPCQYEYVRIVYAGARFRAADVSSDVSH